MVLMQKMGGKSSPILQKNMGSTHLHWMDNLQRLEIEQENVATWKWNIYSCNANSEWN